MSKPVRLLIPAITLAVIWGIGEIHAHLIGHYNFFELPRFAWLCVFVALIWAVLYTVGLPGEKVGLASALGRSTAGLLIASAFVSILALIAASPLLPRFVIFASIALLSPACALLSFWISTPRSQAGFSTRAVIVASREEGELAEIDSAGATEQPVVVVATMTIEDVVVLTSEANDNAPPLVQVAKECRATLIVLNREAQASTVIVDQAATLHKQGVRVRTLSGFYDEWIGKAPLTELERLSLLFDIHELHHQTYPRIKRCLDIVLATVGMVILLVVIPGVLVLNLMANQGPLFYSQDRVGKDGEIFRIIKFRTMAPNHPTTWTQVDDPRIGLVGRYLRRTHLDELPQCINVLRRELSVVGPRPEQPRYVDELKVSIPYYDLRHLVRPGMTGWAQVCYHYGASHSDAMEKLQFDFYYLRHQSLIFDLRIIGRTIRSVVSQGGL